LLRYDFCRRTALLCVDVGNSVDREGGAIAGCRKDGSADAEQAAVPSAAVKGELGGGYGDSEGGNILGV
jgi:hypothetical protein